MAIAVLALTCTAVAADQPAAKLARLHASAADVAALGRQVEAAAKEGKTLPEEARILPSWGPFQGHLSYRSTPQPLYYTNDDYAEYYVFLDGEGLFTLGGALVNPKRTGPRAEASTVEGATVYRVAKGDLLMVPPGVAHAINQVHGKLVYMSMHLQLPAAAAASTPASR